MVTEFKATGPSPFVEIAVPTMVDISTISIATYSFSQTAGGAWASAAVGVVDLGDSPAVVLNNTVQWSTAPEWRLLVIDLTGLLPPTVDPTAPGGVAVLESCASGGTTVLDSFTYGGGPPGGLPPGTLFTDGDAKSEGGVGGARGRSLLRTAASLRVRSP